MQKRSFKSTPPTKESSQPNPKRTTNITNINIDQSDKGINIDDQKPKLIIKLTLKEISKRKKIKEDKEKKHLNEVTMLNKISKPSHPGKLYIYHYIYMLTIF